MKKIIVFILNLILACSFWIPTCITVNADEAQPVFSLQFTLTANNGYSVVAAQPGDVITVAFTMKRTDSNEDYTTNGFQNYICYDRSFFEFVEGSTVCNDTGMAIVQNWTT